MSDSGCGVWPDSGNISVKNTLKQVGGDVSGLKKSSPIFYKTDRLRYEKIE